MQKLELRFRFGLQGVVADVAAYVAANVAADDVAVNVAVVVVAANVAVVVVAANVAAADVAANVAAVILMFRSSYIAADDAAITYYAAVTAA